MKRVYLSSMVGSLLLGAIGLSPSTAFPAESRDDKVRRDQREFAGSTQWIYNDLAQGFSTALRTGKPLLVVLRCVP